MIPINSTKVRFWHTKLPAPAESSETTPDRQSQYLEYLSNLYELILSFPLSQKAQAENLWRELTDRSSTVCLLVQEENSYAVWGLTDRTKDDLALWSNTPADESPLFPNTPIVTTQWLGRSLWLIIADLAGADRARSFGTDLLSSSLPIQSWHEIDTATPTNTSPPSIIPPEQIADIDATIDQLQQLTAKYLGHKCAQQIVQEIRGYLPLPTSIASH